MMRQNIVVTEDSSIRIKPEMFGKAGGELIFYVSGDAGGGTVQLEYLDTFDNKIPLVDGVLEAGSQYRVFAGIVNNLYLTTVGSAGANLNVIVTGKV